MKSKKILSLILCLALTVFSVVPISAQTTETINDGQFTYKITNDGLVVTKYNTSLNGEVEIPATVQGYSVVALGDEIFRNAEGITKITVPEGVKQIGDRAFYACSDLTLVQLPSSLETVGEMAFCNCYSLESLQIPKNVQEIGLSAFHNCTKLQSLTVDNENVYFTALNNVLFSKDMKTLLAYPNADKRTAYTIPDGVERIGEKAFADCGNLQTITFNQGLVEIEKYAFSGCDAITSVDIPDSVDNIGTFAFRNCSDLTSVVLGDGVKTVSAYAFSNCESLNSVKLPRQLQSIGSRAFSGCGLIAEICISDTTSQISSDAFSSTAVSRVRFYSTEQKENFGEIFSQSEIVCLCEGEHTYLPSDPVNCSVCDYGIDVTIPPTALSVTHDTVKLVVKEAFEYSYDLVVWRKDGVFTSLLPNHTYKFYARVYGVQTDVVSDPLEVTTDRAPQPKAPKPVAQSVDETSVTLSTVAGCEYSMDGVTWQTSPKFANLTSNTEYTFYQRYAKSDTHYEGAVSDPATIKTLGVLAVTSTVFKVENNVIRKIPVGTSAEKLLQGLNGGEYCEIYKGDVKQDKTKLVGTGMTVKLLSGGKVVATYTLVVTGDTNGDGNISVTDMIAVKAHVLEKSKLSGVYLTAADTSGDGKITVTDFIQVKAYILGKGSITAK